MTNQPELLLETRLFRVERLVQTTSDGARHPRDVVRHPGAVCVLPLLDHERPGRERVCLIRNERVAVGRTLLELPAGTLEKNEDPRQTARRELAEETGYRAGRIEPLTQFHTSPGILDERMYLFLATELTAGRPDLQPGEEIETMIVPLDEAMEMIRQGRIEDGKTLVGLLWYAAMRRG
ncbi:MAG: NUDIX hydrolase [Pirellulales bacterium]